jgi:ribose 1,5-bisphosphokinase
MRNPEGRGKGVIFIDMKEDDRDAAQSIGPGRLVVLAGPSGAGKDTLLAGAKLACAGDPQIVFPRRILTRVADGSEDHKSVTDAEFDAALRGDAFAFWWEAHGYRYALPRSIDHDLRCGRMVVCNVSRAIMPELRRRYARVLSILITASESVLKHRLNRRARESDKAMAERLARNDRYAGFEADHVVETTGTPGQSLEAFLTILRSR